MTDFTSIDESRDNSATDAAENATTDADEHRKVRPASRERAYVLRLRLDLETNDVVRLIHYVTDFGSGDVRGHVLDRGWCLRLTDVSDLRLLSNQHPELIEGHEVLDDPSLLWRVDR